MIENIAGRFCLAGKQRKQLRFTKERLHTAMMALAHEDQVDPAAAWLNTLPEWDGEARLDHLFSRVFATPQDDLAAWAGRYIIIGAIQRAIMPGCELQYVPVLIGPQGVGKSTFLRRLLPKDRPEWLKEGFHLRDDANKNYEQISRAWIVEYAELAGLRRADVEVLKSFITATYDQIRRPYAPAPEDFPRRCIIVGTSNDRECLPNDPTGNRRFVIVPTPLRVQYANFYVESHARQIWAEGLAMYEEGARAEMPEELQDLQRQRNEEFRDADEIEAVIAAQFEGRGGFWGMHEIALECGLVADDGVMDRRLQYRLGAALRNLGFEKKSKRRHGKVQKGWEREGPAPEAKKEAENAPF